MTGKQSGPNLADHSGEAAIAEFIKTRGVTRCPTACVLPTQGSVAPADRAQLAEYAAAREQVHRARAARQHAFFPFSLSRTPEPAEGEGEAAAATVWGRPEN